MDEQRVQAYLQLIEQLLTCPTGEEGNVLQAQAELADAGLVEVMRLLADQMAAAGHNNAGWLRQFAGQVAQALGLEQASASSAEDTALSEVMRYADFPQCPLSRETQGSHNSGKYCMDQFMGEVMVQISQTQGNPAQVYGFWHAHLDRFNQEFLETLPITFRRLIGQNNPELIATVFVEFGNLIRQFPLGVRWLNLELAVAAYQQALEVYTREAFPEQWAMTQNNLANAYGDRIRGERADNLEQAIRASERALEVYSRELSLEKWAATQNALGVAYTNRIRGDRADNLEQAIRAHLRALEVRIRNTFPEQWAATQNNLANVYSNRIRGDRSDNLEQAIIAYKNALEIYTLEAFPEQWATTQNNLATAYSNRIRGNRSDNLEQAIIAYKNALKVYTLEAFPERWATTQNNLATAYSNRIRGDRSDNLEQAIIACENALEVYTREAFPEQWAKTEINLAQILIENYSLGRSNDDMVFATKILEDVLQDEMIDIKAKASASYMLGNIFNEKYKTNRDLQHLDAAKDSYQSALEFARSGHEDIEIYSNALAKTWSTMGAHLIRDNEWQKGIQLLSESLKQLSQSTDKLAYADALYQTAKTHEFVNDWPSARLYYRDALRLYDHLQHPPGIAQSRHGLGSILTTQGYLEKGIQELQKARKLYQNLNKPHQIADLDRLIQAAQKAQVRQHPIEDF